MFGLGSAVEFERVLPVSWVRFARLGSLTDVLSTSGK